MRQLQLSQCVQRRVGAVFYFLFFNQRNAENPHREKRNHELDLSKN